MELEANTTSRTFFHIYEKGKIASTHVMSTFYDGLQVTPMSSYTMLFSYNDKNLLIEERHVSEDGGLLTTKRYHYNRQDSLMSVVEVNKHDTTLIEQFEVFPDGRKRVLIRQKRLSGDAANDDMEEVLHVRNTYVYHENQLWKSTQHDLVTGKVLDVNYIYQNGKLISELHKEKSEDGKRRDFTKKYDYTKSETLPDWALFDAQGDTVTMIIHLFSNGKLQQTSSYYFEAGLRQEEYFENGLLKNLFACMVNDDKPHYKLSFTHNEKGDVIQELIWMKEDAQLGDDTKQVAVAYLVPKIKAFPPSPKSRKLPHAFTPSTI